MSNHKELILFSSMIGELNRRINVKSWTTTTDAGGGLSPLVVQDFIIWAKVEARNGVPFTSEEQSVWNYDYKVTFRYARSRIVGSNFTIDYDQKRLRINSISFLQEGTRKLSVARCSTIDANASTLDDVSIITLLKTFDYYGIGGENLFVADGSAMTLPTVAKDLRNKTIIGAFKDGIEFAVLLTGTPSEEAKEVLYIPASGVFLWSIPYEPGEHTLIQYF